MKAHPEYRAVLQVLRTALKAKGFTYLRLARELGVSEVTVKRIFSSSSESTSCSVARLFEICERIGVSFLDLAAIARKEEEVDYFLTPAQERYFAEKPAHFAIFKELYRGKTSSEIARSWKLSETRFFRILSALQKIGLIEIFPGNRIRMRVRGTIRMSHRGPLARKILRPQTLDFLDHIDRVLENDDVCMQSAEVELAHSHVAEFVDEINALGAKYRARAFRDRNLLAPEKLKSVRWLFGFAPYHTRWQQYEA